MKLTDLQARLFAEAMKWPVQRVMKLAEECSDLAEVGVRLQDAVKVEGLRVPLTEGQSRVGAGALNRASGGFENFGEFLQVTRFNPSDARVMSMGTGSAGGYLIPSGFSEALMVMVQNQAMIRPRAMTIPADPTTPDASVSLPTLDQSGVKGVYAGVEVSWLGEGGTKPDTTPSLRELTLTPHEVAARCTLSDKLIRNAATAQTIVSTLLSAAIKSAEEVEFIAGNGVGRPLGFLNHASAITISRTTPNTIVFADIQNMLMASRSGKAYAWLGSRSILGQLCSLTLTGGVGGTAQPIWLPSGYEGIPSTLLGLPMLEPESQPLLGDRGDLCLVDLSQYVIKDGYGIEIRMSDSAGTNFETNHTTIKATWNVDGQPGPSTPLLLPNGALCSPFVILE